MATTLTLTEEAVHRLAPDTDAVQAARGLVRKRSFSNPGVSADATWLLAKCQGSGAQPYQVSIDLAEPNSPTFRCSCPSRKLPCKHALGLLLLYTQAPEQFTEQEPSADLLAKREKQAARAEKKKEEGTAAPRNVNKAALAKKAAAQRDGLDLLEKLVIDLVDAGQWFEATRLEKLERQAKQLNDAYLPGAMHLVRRLMLLGRDDGMSEDERMARSSDLIGRRWATVQKGRNYLDNKLAGDESQAEADAVIEEVLGKSWQLTELRDKGYCKSNLELFELAFEATDDPARQQRIEVSRLVELNDGTIYQAITYRPFKGMQFIPEQPSYGQPLKIAEAAVYPGFLNRRVRWDKGAEQVEELKPLHLKRAHDAARPDFKTVLDSYRQQLKNPLAPPEAVVLVLCQRVGRVSGRVVLEDSSGARIEAVDDRKDYSNLANMVRAGGMLGREHPAVLVRLIVQPVSNSIAAVPLALLVPNCHLRLGV
jgi:hypothetical protein